MSDSFVTYRSFHEALKELPPEQYGKIMYAINEYALNQNEIELSGVEKIVFTLIKPQLDANLKRQGNAKFGSLGGRTKKENKNPMGYEVSENENPMGYEVSENENPNLNLNANENLNLNDDGEGEFKDAELSEKSENPCESENQPPPPPPGDEPREKYARTVFDRLKNAGLPCQKGDYFKFLSLDFRETVPKLRGYGSDDVIAALDNYISELRNPDSYVDKEFSFGAFVGSKTFSNCLPANYRPGNFKKFAKDVPKQEPDLPKVYDDCPACRTRGLLWNNALQKYACKNCKAKFSYEEIA